MLVPPGLGWDGFITTLDVDSRRGQKFLHLDDGLLFPGLKKLKMKSLCHGVNLKRKSVSAFGTCALICFLLLEYRSRNRRQNYTTAVFAEQLHFLSYQLEVSCKMCSSFLIMANQIQSCHFSKCTNN